MCFRYSSLVLLGDSSTPTWLWGCSFLWTCPVVLCIFHSDRILLFGPQSISCGFLCPFFWIAAAHTTHVELEVEKSVILQMRNAWYKDLITSSFYDWYRWALLDANAEHVVVEIVWPLPYWIPWISLLPPISGLRWAYSWIDHFARYAKSGSVLLGNFLHLWNLSAWYLVELVHPQHSRGKFILPIAFPMAYSSTLMCTVAVSQLVFYEQLWLGNENYFWSHHWEKFPSWNSPPDSINSIGASSPGSSSAASAEANSYYYIASAIIELLYSYWKLLPKPDIFVEGFPASIPMNV